VRVRPRRTPSIARGDLLFYGVVAELHTLTSGLVFGESPRWGRDGRLWLSDWGAQEPVAVDPEGSRDVVATLGSPTFQPFSIDFLPNGSLVLVWSPGGVLLRLGPDGSFVRHANLDAPSKPHWNEIVIDGRGNAYVNDVGFDLGAGDPPAPGRIAVLTPDGSLRQVADGLGFPNGMAVTPDNSTLICAESYGQRLTAFDIATDGSLSNQRVWAALGDAAPDGICADAEGAVWYGDVPNKRCVRVAEGGEVLQTIELDVGCFACMLGGDARTTLFMVVREWRGAATMASDERVGQVVSVQAPAPGAGWP
jgi:sugar lactone lactonase YvrE